MKRLLAVLFWSVIAAAFIGPGTVTTAAVAGSRHGTSLLWALTFSTVACFALQESAARLTIAARRDLGEALRARYAGGLAGITVTALVVGAIVVGCAAYEAGNILGAAAGVELVEPWPTRIVTAAIGVLAAVALWNRPPRTLARLLSLLVAVMGLAFVWTAIALRPSIGDLARGAFLPSWPQGSGMLVLGLVGTTVVPYNLFLGSGIAAGQDLREARFGLAVAIGLGGLISMGILVVGTAVTGAFGFGAAAEILATRLGDGGRWLFAVGLAAAGLSSAITAPLAAAVTARGLFGRSVSDPRWSPRAWRFRTLWLGVLAVGVGFGVSGIRPVPVILLAQALNGVLLPVAAIFLLLAVNDRRLVGAAGLNAPASNVVLAAVVLVTVALGVHGVLRAAHDAVALAPPGGLEVALAGIGVAVAIAVPIARAIRAGRRGALG